jgi:hypothetical protein
MNSDNVALEQNSIEQNLMPIKIVESYRSRQGKKHFFSKIVAKYIMEELERKGEFHLYMTKAQLSMTLKNDVLEITEVTIGVKDNDDGHQA